MAKRADGAAAPAATPGLVLDGRYRLEQVRAEHQLEAGARSVLWRAIDLPLDRRVAVRLLENLDDDTHESVVAAAARASRLTDGRFVRVLDVGMIDLATGPVTWIATEWVDAPSLAAVVRGEPLAPEAATEVVRQCAEALAGADAAGCHHGRLHPEQVLLPAGGLPRITGLEIAAALPPPPGDATAPPSGDPAAADAVGLGALLFAALTGRSVQPGRPGLPAADARVARQARPRLVRAGIGKDLDDITHRALTGGFADPRAVGRSLSLLPSRPLHAPPPDAPTGPAAWNRWAWRVGPPVVVLAIGLLGWAVGSDLGRVPNPARQQHAALPPAHAAGPGTKHATLVWHAPPAIVSFDPQGDGEEDPDAVTLAVDRDPTTAWETARYRGDSHLGGLKPGVGLLLDLGRRRSVRVAELALTAAGATFDLRAGDTAPANATDLPLVATRSDAGDHVQVNLDNPVRARYWLVWFTNLPPEGGGFQVGVAELALLG